MDASIIKKLETLQNPQELIGEVFKQFGNRAAIGTGGQLTGVVMIDMAFKAGISPRVFILDTLRLFKETYDLLDRLEKHYHFKIERITPDSKRVEQMIKQHGEYLFFDTPAKQEFCCKLRKVEPNEKVLQTVDVWLTGLRADQSSLRASTQKFEMIRHPQDNHSILKIAPLVDWTEKALWAYIHQNKVPHHALLEEEEKAWRYRSLGCVICTTPVAPHEPLRAGRWRWFNNQNPQDQKECGIHVNQK